MAEKLHLEIITPTRAVFRGEVAELIAPGTGGYFGILPRHAPMVASLRAGEIRAKTGTNDQLVFAISGGFLEVSANNIKILADAAERAQEIDVERAQRAKSRAEERLHGGREKYDLKRAEAALARALNRLRVVQKYT